MPRLAEFELRVVLAVLRCDGESYAVAVHRELESRTGQRASLGAVYITLDRLARKGWLASRLGEPSAARGGRAKRYYTVTKRGMALLKVECGAMHRLWQGLGLVEEG